MSEAPAATAAAATAAAAAVGHMPASELSVDLHAGFVKRQSEDTDTIEYVLTEHLRMSGVYWGLTGAGASEARSATLNHTTLTLKHQL
jgi:geranylgeranyl transferase type-2 subunit beta